MVDKVDIDKLPRMTIEQQDALCRPVIGMVRECEYSISPSGYAFWNGKEWQPYYQSRTNEKDVFGVIEVRTDEPPMLYPRNEDGSIQWDKGFTCKESVGITGSFEPKEGKENIYYKRREILDEDGSIKYTALVFHENPNEKEI